MKSSATWCDPKSSSPSSPLFVRRILLVLAIACAAKSLEQPTRVGGNGEAEAALSALCASHGGVKVGTVCEDPACAQCIQSIRTVGGGGGGSGVQGTAPPGGAAGGPPGPPAAVNRGPAKYEACGDVCFARGRAGGGSMSGWASNSAALLCGSVGASPPHAPCLLPPAPCLATRGKFEWVEEAEGAEGERGGPPNHRKRLRLRASAAALSSAADAASAPPQRPVHVAVYRLLGNDMTPLQTPGQLRQNTEYAIAHEAPPPDHELGGVAMVWVLNKLVNVTEERAMVATIFRAHRARYGHEGAQSAPAPVVLRLPLDAKCLACLPKDLRVPYAMGLNEARNAMLRDAVTRFGATWALPLDGNQFLTERFWRKLVPALGVAHAKGQAAVLLPMLRLRAPQVAGLLEQGTEPLAASYALARLNDHVLSLTETGGLVQGKAGALPEEDCGKVEPVGENDEVDGHGAGPPPPAGTPGSGGGGGGGGAVRHLACKDDYHVLSEPQVAVRVAPLTASQREDVAAARTSGLRFSFGGLAGGGLPETDDHHHHHQGPAGSPAAAFPAGQRTPPFLFDEGNSYGTRSKAELLGRLCALSHNPWDESDPASAAAAAKAAAARPAAGRRALRSDAAGAAGDFYRPQCCGMVKLMMERAETAASFASIADQCPVSIRLHSFPPANMTAFDKKTGTLLENIGELSQSYGSIRQYLRGRAMSTFANNLARWIDEQNGYGGLKARRRPPPSLCATL